MGRKSRIKRLPPAIQEEIRRILAEGRLTLDELLQHLRGIGVEEVSRSALGRRKQEIDKLAAKLSESREITETLAAALGPAMSGGRQGRLLVEILRKLIFDLLRKFLLDEGEKDYSEQDYATFYLLARTLRELSQTARLEQDFEAKIRERVQHETLRAVETEARSAGLSAETVDAIKCRILGISHAG